jgi:hypothetical protein
MRHPRLLSPLDVNGWTVATWTLALLGRSIPALALATGSSVALVRKLPAVPPRSAVWLAMRGHLLAGRQFATAARRVWWPVLLMGSVVSRRCRWWLLLALVSDAKAAPTDVAYGWGVWTGMVRARTWTPLVPRLRAWPGRPRRPVV